MGLLTHQAKRGLSFERLLVAARKQVDELRSEVSSLDAKLEWAEKAPVRLARQLDAARATAATAKHSFEAAVEQTEREHQATLKELKAQHGYRLRELQKQMQAERKELSESVTRATVSRVMCSAKAMRRTKGKKREKV